MHISLLGSQTLGKSPYKDAVSRIINAALDAVDPYQAVLRAVGMHGSNLIVDDHHYDLDHFERVFIVGGGKAAYPMTAAMAELLGPHLTRGIIITKDGYLPAEEAKERFNNLVVYEAGHPLPDQRGIDATAEIIRLLESAGEHDLVICLISGGGSALLTAPAGDVSLDNLKIMTDQLLRSGATINQINALRKHLDAIKGGGLARRASPAEILSLILSDVIGDPLDVIASGPTTADESTFQDCWAVLELYQLLGKIPESIRETIQKGCEGVIPETLKPGDPILTKIQTKLIANNYLAAQAALEAARKEGFNSLLLSCYIQGEARDFGKIIAAIARQIDVTAQPLQRPACLIMGGETTVTVRGEGKGGRNLETALGSVVDLAGLRDTMLITLATDGGDGLTEAAGAVVDGSTLARAREKGHDPVDYLIRNDSYHFFSELGDLIVTGPTRTNVNDLAFLFNFL
jgi:glycerate 2-kinase